MRISKLGAVVASSVLALGVAGGPAAAAVAPAETTAGSSDGIRAAATKISHADATNRLSSAGISWSSSGGCSDRNNPTCTSFDQVNLDSIRGIITLKSASGCAINITGGTETGHAGGTYSHWNGYKLDISPAACVSNYITGSFAFIGYRGDGAAMYESGSGNIYARESNHWDILYYNCGGC